MEPKVEEGDGGGKSYASHGYRQRSISLVRAGWKKPTRVGKESPEKRR